MTINCKGTLVDISSPKVMGVLNITPDSFFDGGRYKNDTQILSQVEKMLTEGATFIDVGAYSSKPGAIHISEDEELKRIVPVIDLLLKNFPEIILSIDTFRSKVAQETIHTGAAIINDISGGKMDNDMFATVANLKVPYILMHMQGTPQNMQQNPIYEDVTKEIIFFFLISMIKWILFDQAKVQVYNVFSMHETYSLNGEKFLAKELESIFFIPEYQDFNIGKISDYQNGTIDRTLDVLEGNGEQWARNDWGFRKHVAKAKYE